MSTSDTGSSDTDDWASVDAISLVERGRFTDAVAYALVSIASTLVDIRDLLRTP